MLKKSNWVEARFELRLPAFPFLLSLFLAACSPQEKLPAECPPVEVGNPDGNYIVPGSWGEIVYRTAGGVDLLLDAYVQQGDETRPAVVVVHGGRWTTGSRVTYVGQLLEMLTEAGFNWFSVDYRLAPAHRYTDALEDIASAVDFIRCNATRFKIDPDRMALLGEDSGAHLATLLATERSDSIQALVTFGAPFDLTELEDWLQGPSLEAFFPGEASETLEQVLLAASPVSKVAERMPPVLAVHGTEDRDVPLDQAERYCDRVRSQGGLCEVLAVAGAIHAPENWTPPQWPYKQKVQDWLSRTLGWNGSAAEPYRSDRLKKDLVYGSYEDRQGRPGELKMDAWIPDGEGPFPAVVLVHGGGWEAGDKVTYLTPLFAPLSEAGLAWFSIDYRLTPEYGHPEQLEDLRRAIRFVRHHQERFRIDPERIAIVGESASGQMVLQVAAKACPGVRDAPDPVDRKPCQVSAVVSFYGVYDFLPMVRDASPRSLLVRLFGIRNLDDAARQVLRDFSPLYRVHRAMPPLLLIHGTNESLWEQAVTLSKHLDEVGADYELLALEGAPHGMENWEGHPEWSHYKQSLVDWLVAQWKR